MCLVCPVPNTYIEMQSCIPVMMWWWCGGSATSYPNELVGSTPQTWLNGLALSYVSRLTLSGMPKILLYCMEYNRPTTGFNHPLTSSSNFSNGLAYWQMRTRHKSWRVCQERFKLPRGKQCTLHSRWGTQQHQSVIRLMVTSVVPALQLNPSKATWRLRMTSSKCLYSTGTSWLHMSQRSTVLSNCQQPASTLARCHCVQANRAPGLIYTNVSLCDILRILFAFQPRAPNPCTVPLMRTADAGGGPQWGPPLHRAVPEIGGGELSFLAIFFNILHFPDCNLLVYRWNWIIKSFAKKNPLGNVSFLWFCLF
jgi:hypothetical protein